MQRYGEMDKEIDPMRHKQRLMEDPAYRIQFLEEGEPPKVVEPSVFKPSTRETERTIRIAIVIPAYSKSNNTRNWGTMAADTAKGWKDQCHDLIVSEDGDYCPEIHEIADVYILHERYWPADNMNCGWQLALARGADYVALMDSDVKFATGSLRALCIPGQVTVPKIMQHPDSVSVAPILVVPKEVTEQIGMYDSANGAHGLYWFDNNFQARLVGAGIPLVGSKELIVSHKGGATTEFLAPDDRPKVRVK